MSRPFELRRVEDDHPDPDTGMQRPAA
jgi:hypothetical protein